MGIKPPARTALALNRSVPLGGNRVVPLAPLSSLPTGSLARSNQNMPPAPIGAPLQLGMGRSAMIRDDGVFDPGEVGD